MCRAGWALPLCPGGRGKKMKSDGNKMNMQKKEESDPGTGAVGWGLMLWISLLRFISSLGCFFPVAFLVCVVFTQQSLCHPFHLAVKKFFGYIYLCYKDLE